MKKGQGGLNAAILIAVIGALILAYIIFLPDDEREALLENKSIDKVRDSNNNGGREVLLREFPGRLDTVEEIDDKQIGNVFLYESTNAKELETINPFIIRNGWFDKKPKTVTFSISDIQNTDNVILSFQALKHEGVLSIDLNDVNIFESDMSSPTVSPIRLSRDLLMKDNTLEFSVSTVGAKFWQTNEYSFDTMKIVADVTDKTNQESTSVFTITETDLYNVEEANLRFVPYCAAAGDVGILDIEINGRGVFSAIPVCEDAYKQPLPTSLLKEGQNTISLSTSKGSYSVEQIRVEFDEEDIKTNVYFFELNESHIEDIEEDDYIVKLELEFLEDEDLKRGDINVNNKFFTLDQDERNFDEDITEYVEEGNNFVEIIPRNTIDIREILVVIQEDDN